MPLRSAHYSGRAVVFAGITEERSQILTYMIVVQASSAANQTLRLGLRTAGKSVYHQLLVI
jgi:hypothetical protein